MLLQDASTRPSKEQPYLCRKEPETRKLCYQCHIKIRPEHAPLAVSFSLKQACLPVGVADPDVLIQLTDGRTERSRPTQTEVLSSEPGSVPSILTAAENERDEILAIMELAV